MTVSQGTPHTPTCEPIGELVLLVRVVRGEYECPSCHCASRRFGASAATLPQDTGLRSFEKLPGRSPSISLYCHTTDSDAHRGLAALYVHIPLQETPIASQGQDQTWESRLSSGTAREDVQFDSSRVCICVYIPPKAQHTPSNICEGSRRQGHYCEARPCDSTLCGRSYPWGVVQPLRHYCRSRAHLPSLPIQTTYYNWNK